jgi:ketosteroid isomerase-like protein
MSAEDNINTIQTIYQAFGRGDVQAILAALSDDVDWAAETSSTAAPWYGVRNDKDAVAAFFQQFASSVDTAVFEPTAFAANETDVFALVRYRGTARATGTEIETQLHHYFRFRDGKIDYYRGTEDTAQTERALST